MQVIQVRIFLLIIFSHVTLMTLGQNNPLAAEWMVPDQELKDELSNSHVTFLGGVEIKVNDSNRFGGISAIHITENGSELTAISDYSMRRNVPISRRSAFHRFKISYDPSSGIDSVEFLHTGYVKNRDGSVLLGEIESLASLGDKWYVSLDNGRGRADSIWSLDMVSKKLMKLHEHTPIGSFPAEFNREGIEAMTSLDSKWLLLIHERLPGKKENSDRWAWIISPIEDTSKRIKYQSGLLEVKSACTLPGGDLIILEKTFTRSTGENRIALKWVDHESLDSEILTGELLLEVGSKHLDNFEGISSFEREGETFIWLVSDNNGDWNLDVNGVPRQKTLALLFKLNK